MAQVSFCHPLVLFSFTVHFISIKPVLNGHLSYVTIFHCYLGRSYKTGLTVYLIYSQTCLKGHLHITNQSIKSSFVFSIYWIIHIIWTCVYKGHQFIKGTFSSSLSCPLYTGLTVFEIQDGWFYWIYCIVAYVQSIFVAIFLSERYKRSKDLQ
jgi:hypothetical protein